MPDRDVTRDNTSANDQNPPPKDGQPQTSRTTEGARFDAAVQLSPSMAHLNVGDVVEGKITRFDGEGRPVLETAQAAYVLEPDAGLKAKMTVEIVIQDIDRKATGTLIAKDGVKLETPVALTMTVSVIHGQNMGTESDAKAGAPMQAAPASQTYRATPSAIKTDAGAVEAALLTEAGSKPTFSAATVQIVTTDASQNHGVGSAATERTIPHPQAINSTIATILNAVALGEDTPSSPKTAPTASTTTASSVPVQSDLLPKGIVLAQLVATGDGKPSGSIPPFVALNITPMTAGEQTATKAPLPTLGNSMVAVVRPMPGHEVPAEGKTTLPHTAMVLETAKGAFRLITPLMGAALGDEVRVLILDVPLPDLWNTQATNMPQPPHAPQSPASAQSPATPHSTTAPQSPAAPETFTTATLAAPESPDAPKGAKAPSVTASPGTASSPAAPATPAAPSASAAPASMTALPAFLPIADYLKEWPLMEQLSQTVAQHDPSAASAMATRMPSTTSPQLAGSTLFFLSALGLQNPRAWVGEKVEGALVKAGGGNWLDKLTEEFARLRLRTETATGQAMEWRPHVVPFKTDDGVNAIIVFDRPQEEEKNKNGDDAEAQDTPQDDKKRFVVALDLKRLGAFELDAMWHRNIVENTGKLDLVLRVGESFDEDLKNNLKSMALSTMEASGLSGSLKFENIANSPLHSKELLGRIEQSLHHESHLV